MTDSKSNPPPAPAVSTEFATTNTDFAAALMARGARFVSFTKMGERLCWQLDRVNPAWVCEFRDGSDGIARFCHAKKILVQMAKTETTGA